MTFYSNLYKLMLWKQKICNTRSNVFEIYMVASNHPLCSCQYGCNLGCGR